MQFKTSRGELSFVSGYLTLKETNMLSHKKFKIYIEVLYNCKKRLLRRIRTHYNTSKFTQIVQIIFGKLDRLFINSQIQLCKEYFYPVMIKNLLEIVIFSTLFAKEGLDT